MNKVKFPFDFCSKTGGKKGGKKRRIWWWRGLVGKEETINELTGVGKVIHISCSLCKQAFPVIFGHRCELLINMFRKIYVCYSLARTILKYTHAIFTVF